MTSITSQIHPEKVCPHLGIINDSGTANAFPTIQNYCHQCVPPNTPGIAHQREYCLAAKHIICPLFLSETVGPMPKQIQSQEKHSSHKKKRWLRPLLILAVILAAAAGLFFARPSWVPLIAITDGWTSPVAPAAPTSTAAASPIPAASSTPPATPTATTIPPTLTSTPAPLHLPETYVGPDGKLLLHKVGDGESLISIANLYHTSVDAIKAINASSSTLWVGTLLVIPVGQTDVSAYPKFKVISIDKAGTTLADLASQYSQNVDTIAKYNAVSAAYTFQVGECVLIPIAPEAH